MTDCLQMMPCLGHRPLINLSSLYVLQPLLNTLPPPILRRQFHPEYKLNGESDHSIRSSDMIPDQIFVVALLQLRLELVKILSHVSC